LEKKEVRFSYNRAFFNRNHDFFKVLAFLLTYPIKIGLEFIEKKIFFGKVVQSTIEIISVSQVIQLAVAPVFLLTGIAGLLSVLSGRLGRITDRARFLERRMPNYRKKDANAVLRIELAIMWRRARLINWAIAFSAAAALLVCVVIVTLFIVDFVHLNISTTIGVLFILAMLALIVSLLCFMKEISMATASMRSGLEIFEEEIKNEMEGSPPN